MHALVRTRAGGFAALLLISVAFAGCASGPDQRPGRQTGRREPIPTLSGSQAFFDGQIAAEVRIGAMEGFPRGGPDQGEVSREGRRGRRGGGGGFGGGLSGGPGMTSPEGAGPGELREGPRGGGARRSAPSGPPVMIHLKFTNLGTEATELRIADFLSPLGNFVVHPEKLTLAPGASVEVEPMTSGLAQQVGGGDVSLTLQLGPRQETKTVPLQAGAEPGPESGKSGQTL